MVIVCHVHLVVNKCLFLLQVKHGKMCYMCIVYMNQSKSTLSKVCTPIKLTEHIT